jgi:hypothetical protein
MSDEIRRVRHALWDEMCDKIEALVREYGHIIHDPEEYDEEEWGKPPDWKNPLSITDWMLVIGVEDLELSQEKRGHWVLHACPRNQLPYRSRGLIESVLDDLP